MPREKTEGVVAPDKARKQLDELYEAQNPVVEAPAAPKGAEPGSHPLCPIASDARAMQELFFADPVEMRGSRCVWDQTSYGAPVLHFF